MPIRTRHRTAFSLIEISTLVTIIAIVAAMGAPRYATSLALYRAQAAAQRVAADVNLARVQAKISSAGQSIIFNTATNSYSIPGMPGLSGQPTPYTVTLSNDPYQSTLLSASFSSSSTLTFDRFGQPSAGGSVSIQSGTATKNIVIDPNTGLATVQ